MDRWPTLDASGYLLACADCGHEQVLGPEAESGASTANPATDEGSDHSSRRLRSLMSQTDQPSDWPEELLERLPDEARQRLKSSPHEPGESGLPEDFEKRLRGYGYVLSDDGSGPRLSGQGPRPGTGDLSPLDVVRLAAEMEGGDPAGAERPECPSCQAVLPPESDSCQWCGHRVDGTESSAGH